MEFQSKASYCNLYEYTLEDVPAAIAGDLMHVEEECSSCHATIKLMGQVTIFPVVIKSPL
jgi:hypothetical protein